MKKLILTIASTAIVYAGTGTISGLVFYHFGVTPDESITNSFEYSRVYFGYEADLSPNLSYKFVSDIDPTVSPRTLYLKYAKVDWKTGLGKVVIGVQGMNMFNVQEKTWGYRVVEKSAMHRFKFSSSADLGLGYYTRFGKTLNVSALVTNGPGYKKQENDSYKKWSFQGFVGEPRLDKHPGWNGGVSVSTEAVDVGLDSTDRVTVMGLFGGWATERLRLGVDTDIQRHSFQGLDTETVFSGYGNLSFGKRNIFGRVDLHQEGGETDVYLIAGCTVTPEPGLTLIPLIRYARPENGSPATQYNLTFQFKF